MVPNWALVKLLRWIAPSNVHRSKPRTRPLAERLAPRLLFDVQMDTPSYDSIVGNPSLSTNVFVSECEATNLAFTPGGTSTPTIISAFTDTAMLPYATDPNYFQVVGAASSSNGGTSFSSPSAPILPLTGPTGDSLGTGGNAVLARDNASGTIYLATLSGDRSHSEIQMFQSTNNGATFTGPTIATPGASGGFDKPWLAIDNYPGGNSQAYLTYMYNGQIYLSTRNSGGSWPDMTFARQITSAAQPFAPVIVPTPDHKPYIVYYDGVGGSDGGAAMMYAWAGDGYTPHLLADLNLADPNEQINVWVQTGNPNVQIRGNVFPAVAFNPVSNDLYVAFAARTTDNPARRVYFVSLHEGSNSPTYPIDLNGADGIGTSGALPGEQWQPEIAVSPSGTQLFVGCYDMPNSDGNIYTRGDLASVSPLGTISWNSTTVISGPFLPPSTTDAYDTFTGEVNMGDYQSATADENNFYYSYTKTSPLPYTYNGVTTTYQQEDVYLATIPIPYTSASPAAPTTPQYNPQTNQITWDGRKYSGATPTPTMYVEYCTPGGVWTTLKSGSTTISAPASAGSMTLTGFNYNASQTYYFRLRAQFGTGTDAPPAYSPVIQSWTYGQPDLVDAWFAISGVVTDPNDSSKILSSTYRIHLDLNWNGSPADNVSAELLYRAPGGTTWAALPTSSEPMSHSGGDVTVTLVGQQLSTSGALEVQLCNNSAGGAGLGGGLSSWSPDFVFPTDASTGTPPTPVITSLSTYDDPETGDGSVTVYWDASRFSANDTMSLQVIDQETYEYWNTTNPDTNQPYPEPWQDVGSSDGTQGYISAGGLNSGYAYYARIYVTRMMNTPDGQMPCIIYSAIASFTV